MSKFVNLNVSIIGKIKAISTSKIKKINVIKKKWREKGIRVENCGLNPHSNGEDFSRSKCDFLEIKVEIIIIKLDKIVMIIHKVIKLEIIYINYFKLFDWKSNILIILYK